MFLSDFDYFLPKSFIASCPASPRDSSRLLVYDTKNDIVYHRKFFNIDEFLLPGDVLVRNKSKVVPARIRFENKEIFLLRDLGEGIFNALVFPGKCFKVNREFRVSVRLLGRVLAVEADGSRNIRFSAMRSAKSVFSLLEDIGEMPLPPYIKADRSLFSKYQTVFADDNFKGSVAAPTAGLHFTHRLINKLKKKEVDFCDVVLHVGRGTFSPVSVENVLEHKMHEEFFEMPEECAEFLNKREGRIIAVGTTSVRVLESSYDTEFFKNVSSTDLFILPGAYKWKCVDALITNFHLPKSTLLMLTASFLENKGVLSPVARILELYEIAKKMNYRFYSFGDAMFIF